MLRDFYFTLKEQNNNVGRHHLTSLIFIFLIKMKEFNQVSDFPRSYTSLKALSELNLHFYINIFPSTLFGLLLEKRTDLKGRHIMFCLVYEILLQCHIEISIFSYFP